MEVIYSRLSPIAPQPTSKSIQISHTIGAAIRARATEVRIKVLVDIKDQISLASIQVVHGAQSGGRSCGDETTYGRVVGAGE